MLKKTAHELDVRGLEDEKRVSELNVTVENLNMNVSMQHRTVIGLVEDRKFSFHLTLAVVSLSGLLAHSPLCAKLIIREFTCIR